MKKISFRTRWKETQTTFACWREKTLGAFLEASHSYREGDSLGLNHKSQTCRLTTASRKHTFQQERQTVNISAREKQITELSGIYLRCTNLRSRCIGWEDYSMVRNISCSCRESKLSPTTFIGWFSAAGIFSSRGLYHSSPLWVTAQIRHTHI